MAERILIVDDDASQCRCMAIGLNVEGFEVVEARSGDEALEALDTGPFDVAVVDLMMPGMNGLELCRVMKQRYPGIGVVLTSAYHLSQRQLDLAGIGHAMFLGKPFTLDRLAKTVRDHVPRSTPEPPTPAGA